MANYNITTVKTPNQLELISQNNLKDSAIIVNYGNSLKRISYDVFKSTLGNTSGSGSAVDLTDYYTKYETSSANQLNIKFDGISNNFNNACETLSDNINSNIKSLSSDIDKIKTTAATTNNLGLIKAIQQNVSTNKNIYYLNINNSTNDKYKDHGFIQIDEIENINTNIDSIWNNINQIFNNLNTSNSVDIDANSILELKQTLDDTIEYTYGEEYIRDVKYEISSASKLINALGIGDNISEYSNLSVYIECISVYDDTTSTNQHSISKWQLLSADRNNLTPILIDSLSNIELSTIGIINDGLEVKNDKLLAYDMTNNISDTDSEIYTYKLSTIYLQKNLGGYIKELSANNNTISAALSTEIDDLSIALSTEIDDLSSTYVKKSDILDFISILQNYKLSYETLSLAISVDNSTELSIVERKLLVLTEKE